jgi:prolipoprotein diacylglyceryltransferase
MRPVFVAWLVRHGWPAWFCPDYATMVGLATLIASVLVLRQAKRDRADVSLQARAILCAYLGALVGGYLFEWIRMIPVAIARGSITPILFAGRAAYGGLIFGALAPAIYLRRYAGPKKINQAIAFLDRATIGMGIVFAFVRFGCFLEGCDFGRPTASLLGVRFPPNSLAADAHVLLGWIPRGAASLPVHPTELYESCVGLIATLAAQLPLRQGRRDGTAFATWIATYATGRFLLEILRGDVERGRYASFSTAQWISIALILGVALFLFRSRRIRSLAIAPLLVLLVTTDAHAQDPPPLPPPSSEPVPLVVGPPPQQQPTPPKKTEEEPPPKRIITARLGLASSQTLARPDVPSGWAAELDALYLIHLNPKMRIDLGLEGRRFENAEALHYSLGIAADVVFSFGKYFEALLMLVPHHTWFDFKSDFFSDTNAYGLRYGIGGQVNLERVVLGLTPLAFTTTSSTTVGVISQWEPRLWVGLSF